MPSLKDLKNRINSVKSTRKITSAMKMVAAAKLKRAQEHAEAARPYAERFDAVMANLARAAKDSPTAPVLLTGTGRSAVKLFIVATAERGLCGGFNGSIVRRARTDIDAHIKEGGTAKILTIGRKGRDILRRDYREYLVGHVDLSDVKRVGYGNAAEIAQDVLARFEADEFDVAVLYYNKFKSVISQIPTAQQLIPAEVPELDEDPDNGGALYEYEPEEEEILADLLPKNLAVQIFRALLENAASEQGARMSAMDNATRNAGEMIDRLTIVYNRSRQAAITKELIEIISGAEAL
ncbi:F0F1 ATP synthase subunit gamma [Paralimibaculum aggregatum]|uniref:ATP synthase gamma chain n=1 Tax=Paralimibaculum aggregatum TaxID=3036245 RepID=A0ABQ6LJB2_9RHOB|nr:F0F1 ATP synthase subunit gamma [Limibaculum sp. NKW23]GMG82481.1 F0F1 ATP synthase subunit gamma [Limibaculum sp. NKW23]